MKTYNKILKQTICTMLIFTSCVLQKVHAQGGYVYNKTRISSSGIPSFGAKDVFFDTVNTKPFQHSLFQPQTLIYRTEFGGFYKKEYKTTNTTDTLIEKKVNQKSIFPVVTQQYASKIEGSETQSSARSHIGVGGFFSWGNKFSIRGSLSGGYYTKHGDLKNTEAILANTYFYNEENNNRWELDPKIRASYTPNKFFNFQAGIDQQFIGEGARSMLQGDIAASSPFFQIKSSIWKIQFLNLYQFLREKEQDKTLPKFSASHMVNIQITERFQFGLFESVMFMPKDENWRRGFEIDYLNPFLFYRPQSYSIGSHDRLVIGTNLSYNFDNLMIYGQFLIDEFALNELRERSRWWANKYSGQIGIKGKYKAKRKLLQYRTELNFARPFTYSHINSSTTYGHQGLPLAHPHGGNFVESYSHLELKTNTKWTFSIEAMIVQQGGLESTEDVSFGNDIYAPYTDRPFDHGFRIGGNGKLNRQRYGVEINYLLLPKLNICAFVKPMVEIQGGVQKNSFGIIYGGIRTNLWNDRNFRF